MAAIRNCARPWRTAGSVTCRPSPAATRSTPVRAGTEPTSSPRSGRSGPGSDCRPVTAPEGPRLDDRARTSIEPDRADAGGYWWPPVRRNNTTGDTGELAYYRCWSPAPVPRREPVRVAGRRRTIEEGSQPGKTLTGPDQHQVRRRTGRHRRTIPAMLAHALLAITTATERTENPTPQDLFLIALTCNEIHRLFNTFIAEPIRDLRHRLHRSLWRRRHQHRARTSHHHRRQALPA